MSARGEVDKAAADELELYAENESSLYPQKQNIIKNLSLKVQKGTYDPAKASKLWEHWVNAAAKRYTKEFPDSYWGGQGVKPTHFNLATRKHIAVGLAREYEARDPEDEGLGFKPALPPGTTRG